MKGNDIKNFISKLSLFKIWNAIKVYTSFQLSQILKKPIQWGLPFTISVEPTTTCNLGCPECPSGLKSFTRPTGNIDLEFYTKFLNETHKQLIYLYFYFQGEPYMHPKFLSLVKQATEKGIYTVTSTNAHFLTPRKAKETIESGLDRIIISIDGSTQNIYENYRVNGKLDKVIEGTKNLIAAKKELKSTTPHIIFQMLVVKPNEHQIAEVKKIGQEIGVDEVKLKTAQIYDYKNGSNLIPTMDKYSRYKKNTDGTYSIKNKMENKCWKLWHSNVITWDGKVVPCCFDKDAKYEMGNLNQETFKTIWQNKKYQNFKTQLIKNRKSIDICTNCTEGLKVWED
ncbi:MAG: SPASM domain-containing protein [Bacteroidetes bacterium]|nr:SPASM domain-containing protein [Bacteroidota bacterium]MCB9226716.1 SPASM domain-containing protein [Chitinophagales bacterium]